MAADVVLQTLKHVWQNLAPLQVPIALMGGLAVAVWKHPRLTRDVDILVGIDPNKSEELIQVLKKAGLKPKRSPAVLVIGNQQIIQFLYQPSGTFVDIQVDLLLAEGEYQKQALTRCQSTPLPGLDIVISFLSCEDLLLHKLISGRILDTADAAALLRANRTVLDFAYLQTWLARLNLEKEWQVVWEEAFPGESPPTDSR